MSEAGMLALKVQMLVLGAAILLCMIRAIIGPTMSDRIIGVNVIGAKTTVLLVMIGLVFRQGLLFDLAMIYALLLFVATLTFMKFMDSGSLEG